MYFFAASTIHGCGPAENVIAHAVVDLRGFQKLEVIFDTTTGDPTGANLLIAFL